MAIEDERPLHVLGRIEKIDVQPAEEDPMSAKKLATNITAVGLAILLFGSGAAIIIALTIWIVRHLL